MGLRLLNTGAGHHVPTGSPFEIYRIRTGVVNAEGTPVGEPQDYDLGRTIGDEPPWATTADNRIPAGSEISTTHIFNLSQRDPAQDGFLQVSLLRVVEGVESDPVVLRRIPVAIL